MFIAEHRDTIEMEKHMDSGPHAARTGEHRSRVARGRVRREVLAAVAATFVLLCSLAASVTASSARAAGAMTITSFDADMSDYQAGGHPDVHTSFSFATEPAAGPLGAPGMGCTTSDGSCTVVTGGSPKDVVVDLPKGVFGDPGAATQCTLPQLTADHCPVTAQVGTIAPMLMIFGAATGGSAFGGPGLYPIYSMVPERGEVAKLGFRIIAVNAFVSVKVRTDGDYGLTAASGNIPTSWGLQATDITLWGVPNDPIHDAQRACYATGNPPTLGCGVTEPLKPFMVAPSECGVDGVPTMKTRSYQRPTDDDWISAAATPHQVTGCEQLTFDPSISVTPTTTLPDASTGLDVSLTFPQHFDNPAGLESPPLKDARVTLPEGMTINPSSAAGLAACSDTDLGLHSSDPVRCPLASKIGTVEATTPVLSERLSGGIYLRPQASSDPASGEMFRIALVVESQERGLSIRLPGSVRADPQTGRLTATFDNNPQLPVSEITLRFKSGPRAPLATPPTCGEKTVEAHLTSWSGQTADLRPSFAIDCVAGLGGFGPSFAAGTAEPLGGAFSPFNLNITKPDGDPDINGLSMVLPTGLVAMLKGNVGTQVGSVKAFAGPGSSPFVLPGKVFLEGQYGDAPFSLRVVVPAKAGPFDLGEVVVRQKIYVDPIDAHVTVVSDPIPTIVKGVPVRLQRLDVSIDKPEFMVNPTSCAAKTIGGTLGAVDGQSAPVSVRFQVGDCGSLALKPALALSLSGKGQTRDGGHPAISATLTQPAGGANLKKVRVQLPSSLALDPDNAASDGLCSFVEGSKPLPVCPASSVVGKATAVSPILNEPLSGPVYFVKNERKDPKSGRSIKTTPKLVIPLTGENGVKLTLTGVSSVPDNEHLVTTFDAIPDAPVSSFKLDINGGKKGILVVSGADICKATQIADQQVDGQNNKAADADVYIQTPSCPTKIISKKIGKKTVVFRVGGLGAGKVTITGKGIKKTTKTITKSTVATITAHRTKGTPGGFKVRFVRAKAAAMR